MAYVINGQSFADPWSQPTTGVDGKPPEQRLDYGRTFHPELRRFPNLYPWRPQSATLDNYQMPYSGNVGVGNNDPWTGGGANVNISSNNGNVLGNTVPGSDTLEVNSMTPPTNNNPAPVTNNNSAPAASGGGGGGGGLSLRQQMEQGLIPWDDNLLNSGGGGGGGPNPQDILQQGYDQYIGELNDIASNYLPQQSAAQGQIAQNQYNTGIGDLANQQSQQMGLVDTARTATMSNQEKNLKDISANLRNMFNSGNTMLGARGAGDSSAANQYSYALTKLGNQQRGNVMTNTADTLKQLEDKSMAIQKTFDTARQSLASDRDNKILALSNWLSQAQMQIKQEAASAGLGKTKDIAAVSQSLMANAMNQLNQIDAENRAKSTALQQWAMNNSKDIASLKANLTQAQSLSGTLLFGGSNQQSAAPVGMGASGTQQYDIYGNPIKKSIA